MTGCRIWLELDVAVATTFERHVFFFFKFVICVFLSMKINFNTTILTFLGIFETFYCY